jgi:hypothetical protein
VNAEVNVGHSFCERLPSRLTRSACVLASPASITGISTVMP